MGSLRQLRQDATSGMTKVVPARRTGVAYQYATNAAPFDTGFVLTNNCAGTSQLIKFALIAQNGTLIGGSVLDTGSPIAFGESYASTVSAHWAGQTGILVAWLVGNFDDGNEEDLGMSLSYAATGFNQAIKAFYPPDLRNQQNGHPSRQVFLSQDAAGNSDIFVIINISQFTILASNGLPGGLSGNNSPVSGAVASGTYGIQGGNKGTITGIGAGFYNANTFNLASPASGDIPFVLSGAPGDSLTGNVVAISLVLDIEYAILNARFLGSGLFSFFNVDQFYI